MNGPLKKRYAMIGAAGFVAPRHMRAIKETGGHLVGALDPHDSVGVLDSYFPEADFFREFERFDRFADKLRRHDRPLDYVSICSPNYLHDAHIRFALRNGADAICEKPLVLNPWNLDELEDFEKDIGRKVYTVLQLRLHPAIQQLRERVANAPSDKVFDVDLTYLTSRGHWYFVSWKGDTSRSGGIATNIGVHFFDMLAWVFGPLRSNVVHFHQPDVAAGYLEFERARVRWFLSVNADYLPKAAVDEGKTTFRSVQIEGEELEFSQGFTDLHTRTYQDILDGGGYGIADARDSINTVFEIREARPVGLRGEFHPLCRKLGSSPTGFAAAEG